MSERKVKLRLKKLITGKFLILGNKAYDIFNQIQEKTNAFFFDLFFIFRYSFFIITRFFIRLSKRWTFWLFGVLDFFGAINNYLSIQGSIPREGYSLLGLGCFIIAINDVTKEGEYKIIKKETKKFIGHTFKINKIILSSDEKLLVSASDRGAIVWDVEANTPLQRLQCSTWVGNILFANDDQNIIGIGGKGLFFNWNLKTGDKEEFPLEITESVAITITRDEKAIATAGKDGVIKLWRFPGLIPIKNFSMGKTEIRKVEFSPDQNKLLASDVSGKVSIFNINEGLENVIFIHPDNEPIRFVCFSPQGEEIAFIDGGGNLHFVDMTTMKWIHTKNAHTDMGLCCAFSQDGQYLASGGQDNLIIVWKKNEKKLIRLFSIHGHTDAVTSLVFNQSNNLYSASRDNKIKYWKLENLLVSNKKRKDPICPSQN